MDGILLTSAASKVPLAQRFKYTIKNNNFNLKLFAGDIQSNAVIKYFVDEYWLMPLTIDLFLDKIIDGCIDRNIKLIIPTRDGELLFFSKNVRKFQDSGIQVLISPISSLRICNDKFAFYKYGADRKLPFIQTTLNIEELSSDQFVVKEQYGAGSKKIGINLSKNQAILHSKKLLNPIYQPYIAGREISIDAWYEKDLSLKGFVLRTRDLVDGGEAKITRTFRDPLIENKILRILDQFNFYGPVVMQAILSRNGEINIIECNARFGGASTVSCEVGLHTFEWSILSPLYDRAKLQEFKRFNKDVIQVRVSKDYIFDDISI